MVTTLKKLLSLVVPVCKALVLWALLDVLHVSDLSARLVAAVAAPPAQ